MVSREEQRAICAETCPAQCLISDMASRRDAQTERWTDIAAGTQAWAEEELGKQLPAIDELVQMRQYADTDTAAGAESADKLDREARARGGFLAELQNAADVFTASDARSRKRNAESQRFFREMSETALNTCKGVETSRKLWPPREFGQVVVKCTGVGIPGEMRQGEMPRSAFS